MLDKILDILLRPLDWADGFWDRHLTWLDGVNSHSINVAAMARTQKAVFDGVYVPPLTFPTQPNSGGWEAKDANGT